jgi:hypothetical protein
MQVFIFAKWLKNNRPEQKDTNLSKVDLEALLLEKKYRIDKSDVIKNIRSAWDSSFGVEIKPEDLYLAILLERKYYTKLERDRVPNMLKGGGWFMYPDLYKSHLYGKYRNVSLYTLNRAFSKFLRQPEIRAFTNDLFYPYLNINFFDKPIFNELTEKDVKKLRRKQVRLDESVFLSGLDWEEHSKMLKRKHLRNGKKWNPREKKYLQEAMKMTNDLEVLSDLFGRSTKSIKMQGRRLLVRNS